jgi:hypothetical protein
MTVRKVWRASVEKMNVVAKVKCKFRKQRGAHSLFLCHHKQGPRFLIAKLRHIGD